jgi:hypothetical protein
MKQQIFVNGEHEYDFEEHTTPDGILYTLSRSDSQKWSEEVRSKVVYSVLNTGDGFVFDQKIHRKMDYHDAFSLSIILKKISFNELTVEITQIPKIELL